ncbi:MAG: peptide chain release factor N(5)-glutamine methyltransferase [Planctomycetes bacterium]|nr:peptide chain release factor N(5)-glutamine methyltransferase [Planctomycetota bacterium]
MPNQALEKPERWTTRRLLAWMAEAFAAAGLDSPRLMAELMLSHVIGCERLRLYMEGDRPAAPLELDRLRELTARALKHEPVQYLTGEAWFFGLGFKVDRRVLIPRPSSETIVERVFEHCRAAPGFGGRTGQGVLIADVCTGSACIAVALAKNLPGARVVATDISHEALEVAAENVARHAVSDRIDLLAGDLLAPLYEHPATSGRGSLHYLVSNPPYIPDAEWARVEANVKEHEPTVALRGGGDGLAYVRSVLEGAAGLLRPGGIVLVELAESAADEAEAIARGQEGLVDVELIADFEGKARVVCAQRAV